MVHKKEFNEYVIEGDITRIIIYGMYKEELDCKEKLETIIDTKNLQKIKDLQVHLRAQWSYTAKTYYVAATTYLGWFNGKAKHGCIYLHRFLLGLDKTDGYKNNVDHINHDSLDNRELNLREKSVKDNDTNRKGANCNNKTGHRNISFYKDEYLVQFQIDGKNKVVGRYKNLKDAIRCAKEMRKKYYKPNKC